MPLPLHFAATVARARWALLGLFWMNGVTFSSWLARLPAVRDALELTESQIGAVLLFGALGALLTVPFAGALMVRIGAVWSLRVGAAVFALAYVLKGVATQFGSTPVLALALLLTGVGFAIGNVPLNVEASRVERAMGRTVLPHFHAAFSIGAVTGAVLGAGLSGLGVPVVWHLIGVGLASLAWRLKAVLNLLPSEPAAARPIADSTARTGDRGARAAFGAWLEPRTLLIASIAFAASLSEGSANDWLSLAVVDSFGSAESVGALMFGSFVAAMTAVRLLGVRLVDSFGRVRVLRVSGVTALCGLLLFVTAPALPVAALGTVAWGAGSALAMPIAISSVSDDPLRAPGRVSVVASFQSTASLVAPPLLGLLAHDIGVRTALGVIAIALVGSVVVAGVVRERRSDDAREAGLTRARGNAELTAAR